MGNRIVGDSKMVKNPADLPMLIGDYVKKVEDTDQLGDELAPILFGLYGEVGSLMAVSKKEYRETQESNEQKRAKIEEFGDTLWYIAALCRREKCPLENIVSEIIANENCEEKFVIGGKSRGTQPEGFCQRSVDPVHEELFALGRSVAMLLNDRNSETSRRACLVNLVGSYFRTLRVAKISIEEVTKANWKKTTGVFVEPNIKELPKFDSDYDACERLPSKFKIEIGQCKGGQSYLRWKGVKIGDPLTDNIMNCDGYRYHDVFHFAYAAILNWSPVVRSLIKHKRKSSPSVDEAQDGGRAIVVEEGLTAWIFSRAKEKDYFRNYDSLPFDMLKTVQQFIAGYEVEQCPLKLWERAILDGYRVFREVREHEGGILEGNLDARTFSFLPLS